MKKNDWLILVVSVILGFLISHLITGCGGPAFQSASDVGEHGVLAGDLNDHTDEGGATSEVDSNADSGSDSASDVFSESVMLESGRDEGALEADSGPETPTCYGCGSSACVGTSGGPGTGCGCLVDPHTWQPDQSATAVCAYAK